MIRMSITVAVVQWTLLFAFGVLVIILYRQLAYFLHLNKSVSGQGGLDVGERAPEFRYRLARVDAEQRTFKPEGRPSVLMFADPSCSSCEQALTGLERVSHRRGDSLQVLVVTDENSERIEAAGAFRDTGLELGIVPKGLAFKLYRAGVTPFIFGIGDDGLIRQKGAVASERDIGRLIRDTVNGRPAHADGGPALESAHKGHRH